jgi:uncharacterized membrane protein YhaH (DUF805 family)
MTDTFWILWAANLLAFFDFRTLSGVARNAPTYNSTVRMTFCEFLGFLLIFGHSRALHATPLHKTPLSGMTFCEFLGFLLIFGHFRALHATPLLPGGSRVKTGMTFCEFLGFLLIFGHFRAITNRLYCT